jgi:tetratricopeptide (TPR) repeat protein
MNNNTEEFLHKLSPCIERGDLDACVEEAARLAEEMGVAAEDLLELSAEKGMDEKHDLVYVLALTAAQGLKNNKKAEAYIYAGFSADIIGKLREAEKYYKKAIEIDPNNAGVHNNYSNLLREKGLLADAEKEIRNSLQIAEEDSSWQQIRPYAHGNLGDILADEGSLVEAEKEYQSALKNSASMEPYLISKLHNNLGWVYVQLKQYSKAKNDFKKAVAFDPLNVKATRNLRKLDKLDDERDISSSQKLLGFILLLPLIASYFLFWNNRLTETAFTVQIIFFIASLIFILLFNQIERFKAGTVEFEMNTEHGFAAKSQPGFER